jgi:hypothetical protein
MQAIVVICSSSFHDIRISPPNFHLKLPPPPRPNIHTQYRVMYNFPCPLIQYSPQASRLNFRYYCIHTTELRTSTSGMTAVGPAPFGSSVSFSFGFSAASVSVVSNRAISSSPSVSMSCATGTAGVDPSENQGKTQHQNF